jgi:antitoxin VapB
MAHRTAKLFVNGGSQAVRLPAEFRFDGSDEVFIRRDAVTGDVILSARRTSNAWREFFALRDQAEVPDDFMNDRPLNEPLKPRGLFEER